MLNFFFIYAIKLNKSSLNKKKGFLPTLIYSTYRYNPVSNPELNMNFTVCIQYTISLKIGNFYTIYI